MVSCDRTASAAAEEVNTGGKKSETVGGQLGCVQPCQVLITTRWMPGVGLRASPQLTHWEGEVDSNSFTRNIIEKNLYLDLKKKSVCTHIGLLFQFHLPIHLYRVLASCLNFLGINLLANKVGCYSLYSINLVISFQKV